MTRPSDLPLYLKSYKLLIYLYYVVSQFPKSYKFSLGEDTVQCVWGMLDKVVEANLQPNSQKQTTIAQAVVQYEKYILRIKIAHDLRLVNDKKYAFIMEQNEEIGKMLTGWLSWSKGA